jgi:hypothetical protein
MLFVKKLAPNLIAQSDSIKTKDFFDFHLWILLMTHCFNLVYIELLIYFIHLIMTSVNNDSNVVGFSIPLCMKWNILFI